MDENMTAYKYFIYSSIYEGRSKSNASYFLTPPQMIGGG